MDGMFIKALAIGIFLTIVTVLAAAYTEASDDDLSIADAVEEYLEAGDE